MDNQISHEDFMTIINEERNYRELKESIRMMKGQEDKKQILINLLILIKYKAMLSYCLKCKKKKTKSTNPIMIKTRNGRTMILSKRAIPGGKNENLLKNKKQVEY